MPADGGEAGRSMAEGTGAGAGCARAPQGAAHLDGVGSRWILEIVWIGERKCLYVERLISLH